MNQIETSQPPQEGNEKKHHHPPMATGWIAAIAALLFGVLYAALPENITIGPGWIPLALEVVILLPLFFMRVMRHPLSHHTARIFGFVLLALMTVALITGVTFFIITLPKRTEAQAASLLRTGALLWLSNILVFALWYWQIDGGGPQKRHLSGHQAGDFMFPQQTDGNTRNWAPNFIDYLFVAFTGATALSPTDTYPLTRPAKFLMMIEAILALIMLAILIGRAVNIL